MGSITFLEHDGTEHLVNIETGKSLMQIAIDSGVPGIDADCGGECACGTCHVILEGTQSASIGKASDEELQMLDLIWRCTQPSSEMQENLAYVASSARAC